MVIQSLKGNIPLRTSEFKHFLKLLAMTKLGTRWALSTRLAGAEIRGSDAGLREEATPPARAFALRSGSRKVLCGHRFGAPNACLPMCHLLCRSSFCSQTPLSFVCRCRWRSFLAACCNEITLLSYRLPYASGN